MPAARHDQRYKVFCLRSESTSQPILTASAPTGSKAAQRVRADGVFTKSDETRFEQIERNIEHSEPNESCDCDQAEDEHKPVPAIPGGGGPGIFLAIHGGGDELLAVAQSQLGPFQARLQKAQSVLVGFGVLPMFLPFDGMMMQEQAAMVFFDIFQRSRAIFDLVLNKLEVNGRENLFTGLHGGTHKRMKGSG